MQFGAAKPRQRPRVIDVSFVPPEFRRRPFPVLTAGLSLVLVGAVLLLYGIFYLKTYADLEVLALRGRVLQAQQVVRTATGEQAVENQQRQRAAALADDAQTILERQVSWGRVLRNVGDTPPGISIDSINQAGYNVTVHGYATDYAGAALYVDQLRQTDLFLNIAAELTGEAPVQAAAWTPTSGPATPRPSTATPAAGAAPAPTVPATPAPRPTTAPTPIAAASPLASATRPAALTPTPANTPTPYPTPLFDYAVDSRAQSPHCCGPVDVNYVRGRVVDASGQPIPGLRFRISSDGSPPWSADGPPVGQANGTVEFVVTRGRFSVVVLDARSETASGLYTGSNSTGESYDWNVVFKKATPVPTPDSASGSPGPTGTPTSTPTPSGTPVSPGPNIAPDATVSVSNNANDARLAVDGDVNTSWNSQSYPVQQIQLDFGNPRQVEGIELIVNQNPAGNATHEMWVNDETGDWTLATTFQAANKDGDVLAFRFSPTRSVRKLLIRTIRGVSFVAWREIRVFQPLPSPAGTDTPTPTVVGSATATAVSTPTPVAPGPNIAGSATPVVGANPTEARKAIDGNTATFWSAGAGPPQTFQLNFSSFHWVAGVELVPALINQSGTPLAGTVAEVVELWYWDGFNWILGDTVNATVADGGVLGIEASALPTPTPTSTNTPTNTPAITPTPTNTPAITPTSTNTSTRTATPGPTNAWYTSAIFARVIRGNNPVAWREIRVYEQLAPPAPLPTTQAFGPAFVFQPPRSIEESAGLGLGPGSAPGRQPARATPVVLAPGTPRPGGQADGGRPIAFLLVLEVKSGGGYR